MKASTMASTAGATSFGPGSVYPSPSRSASSRSGSVDLVDQDQVAAVEQQLLDGQVLLDPAVDYDGHVEPADEEI